MTSLDRYKKRKVLIDKISNTATTSIVKQIVTDKSIIEKNEQHSINDSNTEKYCKFDYNVHLSRDEVKEFLEKFKHDFNQARFDKLITDCKKDVIKSIATPFGLGHLIIIYDKVNWNLDTNHSVRNQNYAVSKLQTANNTSTNQLHTEIQYKSLRFTSIDIENSKHKKDIFFHNLGKLLNKDHEKIKKMHMLKAKMNLSEKDQKELFKLGELTKINDKKMIEINRHSTEETSRKATAYHSSDKFLEHTAEHSISESTKIGMQQTIGLVMAEFFSALFDEILDIYKNGFTSGFEMDGFLKILKERIKRIVVKLQSKWKDLATAFKDGIIFGLISNLATITINMFFTTGRKLMRIIREGMFALLKAVKFLVFTPENMTYEEAMHEAKKLISTGLLVSFGVLIEEAVSQFLNSTVVLTPFSDILSAIFVGAITGFTITMVAYYLDKKKNDEDAIEEMINQTDTKFENLEQMLKVFVY